MSCYNDHVRDILRDEREADSMILPHGKEDNVIRDVFILKQLGVPQELLILLINGKEEAKNPSRRSLRRVLIRPP